MSRTQTTTFICGCGHSGTSLLANMFAAHPDVFIPLRETGTFLVAEEARARWRELEAEWKGSGRSHLVEKTPRHIEHLDDIRKLAVAPRFLIMVRDGRDVATSYVKRFNDPVKGMERWEKDNSVAWRESASPDVRLIRYEDLVAETEKTVAAACEFAEVPYYSSMLEYHRKETLWFGQQEIRQGSGVNGAEHKALRNWQINQPVFDGSGVWKSKLPKKIVEQFSRGKLGQLMQNFGYL
jgi:hypothetical protein